jgi:hypothetical protein
MQISYMCVSSESDRQTTDLQRDALLAGIVSIRQRCRISPSKVLKLGNTNKRGNR